MQTSTSDSPASRIDQRDEHADQRQQADQRRDQPGLQEVRQRVDVGRHPGEDSATHLALVIVQAEALQVRERLHPQQVEQPLTRAPGHQLRIRAPRNQSTTTSTNTTADATNSTRLSLLQHAVVDPGAHQRRREQLHDACRVRPAPNPISMTRRTGPHQIAQPELRVGGVRERIGDVGLVGRRRQRIDLGQQFGRGRHGGEHVRRRGSRAAGGQRRTTGLGVELAAVLLGAAVGAPPPVGVTRAPTASAGAARSVVPASTPSASSPGPDSSSREQRAPLLRARPGCRRRRPGRVRARRCDRPGPGSSGGARSAAWCDRGSPRAGSR